MSLWNVLIFACGFAAVSAFHQHMNFAGLAFVVIGLVVTLLQALHTNRL